MKLKDLFKEPSKWTKGANARNSQQRPTFVGNLNATCYCLYGGLKLCYPKLDARMKIWDSIATYLNANPIEWNDAPERTIQDVIKLVNDLDI